VYAVLCAEAGEKGRDGEEAGEEGREGEEAGEEGREGEEAGKRSHNSREGEEAANVFGNSREGEIRTELPLARKSDAAAGASDAAAGAVEALLPEEEGPLPEEEGPLPAGATGCLAEPCLQRMRGGKSCMRKSRGRGRETRRKRETQAPNRGTRRKKKKGGPLNPYPPPINNIYKYIYTYLTGDTTDKWPL